MKINQSLIFVLVFLSGLALGNSSFAQTKLNLGSLDINENSILRIFHNYFTFTLIRLNLLGWIILRIFTYIPVYTSMYYKQYS